MTTGTALLLCRAAAHALPGIRFGRPAVNLFTIVAETAGADGLKIAETFPEGRGSPHGCGLRAVFCTDAASARPEAFRDKSKGPRSGDFAGRSPGVQGAAATGRPLCAPCAMIDISQTSRRERKLRCSHRYHKQPHCSASPHPGPLPEGEGTVRLAFRPAHAQRRQARYQARYP